MATENIEVVAGEVETTVGMPQLDLSTWPNQIFWLLVALVAIYLILTRVALPRIGGVLAERSGAIISDLAAAEELKGRAVAAEAAYNDALARARTEAARIAAEAKADIQRDLDAATATADAEIAARTVESEREIGSIREGALSSVTEVATETAEAILDAFGGTRDAGSVSAAVAARMQGDAR